MCGAAMLANIRHYIAIQIVPRDKTHLSTGELQEAKPARGAGDVVSNDPHIHWLLKSLQAGQSPSNLGNHTPTHSIDTSDTEWRISPVDKTRLALSARQLLKTETYILICILALGPNF